MTRLRKLFPLTVLFALSLAACAGSTTPPGEDGANDGLPGAGIATVLTRSGFAAVFGESQQAGVDLAVKHCAAEEIADVTVVASEDAGESPSTALSAYRRAVGAEPIAVIGPIVGPMSQTIRPDLERDQLPYIVTSATRDLTLNDNKWIFRNFTHGGTQANATMRFAFDELGIKRPAILADNTSFGQDDAAALIQEAQDRGLSVVANESTDPEGLDVSGQVSRILRADADAVWVQMQTGSPLATAIRSLRAAGYDGEIFSAPGLPSPSTLELLSEADVEGAYTPGLVFDRSRPEVQAYLDAFNEEYGRDPDIFSAVMYDSVRMICEAVSEGATSPDELWAALSSMRYEGISAQYQSDEEGNLVHTVDILQFDDAKTPSPVATFEVEFTSRDVPSE